MLTTGVTDCQQKAVGVQRVATMRARCRQFGNDLAYGYRVKSEQGLVSGQRAVLHTLFGYVIAAQGGFGLLAVNTAVIALLFMFFGAFDNYWDWALLGEKNGTQRVIQRWRLSRVGALLFTCAPWLLILPLLHLARAWGMSLWSEVTFWLINALGVSYMVPGIRLKKRRLGFMVSSVWACLLFLQAYLLSGETGLDPSIVALCGAVFNLVYHGELLHQLDDQLRRAGEATHAVIQTLVARLRRLSIGCLVASLLAAFINPWFLNTAVWSIVRRASLRRLAVEDISTVRLQGWHPIWSLYEFAIYAVLGLLHVFG